MKVHKVKDCCCGCSLDTGTKIIAWLQIISGVVMTLNFITAVAVLNYVNQTTDLMRKDMFADLIKMADENGDIHDMGYVDFPGGHNFTSFFAINNEDGTINMPRPTPSMFIGYIVCGVIVFILGVILLLGATNSRPHLLRIWIVASLVGFVLYLIIAIIQVILVVIEGLYIAAVYILFTFLVGSLLNYYCIMVVSSFRKQILSGNNAV